MSENNETISLNIEDIEMIIKLFSELDSKVDYIIEKLKQNGIDIYADSAGDTEVREVRE